MRFYEQRNVIRSISTVTWLLYAMVMEASPLQGTFGKYLLGLRVVGPDGQRLSVGRSIGRNAAKILSSFILCLGYLWAAFSKDSRTWHDMIADTSVVVVVVE